MKTVEAAALIALNLEHPVSRKVEKVEGDEELLGSVAALTSSCAKSSQLGI